MKAIFQIIRLVIAFALIIGTFYLLINKTFIYETYKSEVMEGDGIAIKRFVYFLNENDDLQARFLSPMKLEYLNEMKNNYLNSLTKCYDRYYYDENNNITIEDYRIINHDYYRDIIIKYSVENYCSDDYVLRDMWVYEYVTFSRYISGPITSKSVKDLVDKVAQTERVKDPVITDYNSEVSYTIMVERDGSSYDLIFEDFSESELKVTKKVGGFEQWGVYKMDNVVEYLNSLEKSEE